MKVGEIGAPNFNFGFQGISQKNIHESVLIRIPQSYTGVAPLRCPNRQTIQQVCFHTLGRLLEGQKRDSIAIGFLRIINEFNDLVASNPSMRMEDPVKNTLLVNREIQGPFPVFNGLLLIHSVQMLCLPVARHHGRELPSCIPKEVGIRIVLNGGRECWKR